MNRDPLSIGTLMAKAETACSSARVLLELGDVDGASNRAYYAMFDAARAALLASGEGVVDSADPGRTHSSLIGGFGLHLVKSGRVSREMGRLLNRAHEIRQVADYKAESVELEDAKELVEQAEVFVANLRAAFLPDQPAS